MRGAGVTTGEMRRKSSQSGWNFREICDRSLSYFSPHSRVQSIAISVSVCLSVCPLAQLVKLPNFTKFLHLLPDPVLVLRLCTTLQYTDYFRFCGWYHVVAGDANRACAQTDWLAWGQHCGEKFDVYDCLVVDIVILLLDRLISYLLQKSVWRKNRHDPEKYDSNC